ncbi:hypothetical protein A1A1_06972 [Planococcus antarcticus DSM 14505]|uniref:Uncharacterized protein n=1 Tax=Planococcus antarcticus DSM 14505 TaxID=1185653 RepID=A0AA87IMJ9_9BACL|nr:hypothetical protein [Planococcus antarcticus]EIM07204.1 hypothetical protein A1A1_06972 [Planococcus antarcticus DSM 14505]
MREIDVEYLKDLRKKKILTEKDFKYLRTCFLDTNSNIWEYLFEGDSKVSSLYVESFYYFLKNRKTSPITKPKVGEIYKANLLLGYEGEASLIHPVLILEVIGGRALIIPGSSSNSYVSGAYHWVTNKEVEKIKTVLIKKEESKTNKNRALDIDTAFKLDNTQFISLTKIVEKDALGYIKTNSETFKIIKYNLFDMMFPKENILFIKEMEKNQKLKSIIFKFADCKIKLDN